MNFETSTRSPEATKWLKTMGRLLVADRAAGLDATQRSAGFTHNLRTRLANVTAARAAGFDSLDRSGLDAGTVTEDDMAVSVGDTYHIDQRQPNRMGTWLAIAATAAGLSVPASILAYRLPDLLKATEPAKQQEFTDTDTWKTIRPDTRP